MISEQYKSVEEIKGQGIKASINTNQKGIVILI